ncbi:uncharacterized protein LOC112494866 [Cephus cinctus]|uniref:Uncharacterized protein LOC112494866 n=1 Tax=Cephus cinctus TaxID=211228 RepID=A0AAJ7RND1_CEPCN|nr:uncharacterized protein LOC112494866 [Cephus cinctus]
MGKFPVGHPRVYVGNDCRELTGDHNNIDSVEGLIKCVVLPPRDLYHPVLPTRMHGKLLFALCRSCAESTLQGSCPHENPEDRIFEGTWVVDEVRRAVRKGYQITAIHEIWQYEITQYDPTTRTGGHFASYINTFLKIKQEASVWPRECSDDESKKLYVEEYDRVEGIRLDPANIKSNPGLRAVAKLCLNSFWGKFGQRENLPKTEIVTTRQKLVSLLTCPEVEITGILPVDDEVLYVNTRSTSESVIPTAYTNVVIAAYTTAQARLKLYDYLEKLDRRVLYYDTDSCIYVSGGRHADNAYEPPLGSLLGDLTDELESYGIGSYITSFVSGGPKFYAYRVRKPDGSHAEVCKVKGITIDHATSLAINYDWIRSYVTGETSEAVVLRYDAIRRTPFHDVVTRVELKTCKPTELQKRRRDGRVGSLPYGFM